jgi:hypothetical protein
MPIKQKLLDIVAAHPKLITLVTGLALTLAIGTVIGTVEVQQAHAVGFPGSLFGSYCSGPNC